MGEFDELVRQLIRAMEASRDESLSRGARCAAWVHMQAVAWRIRRRWARMEREIAEGLGGSDDDSMPVS